MQITDILVLGLQIGALDKKLARYVEDVDTHCALTGAPITRGIPLRRVVSSNTGEFLDLTSGFPTGYFSESAARAFKGAWNMGSVLIFEDGTCYRPLISAASAADSPRPCWSDLVREIWPARRDELCLAIVATDVKKKVWPLAQVGELGTHTPVLLFDNSRALLNPARVDWPKLLDTLDVIEALYTAGFNKAIIADNLLNDVKTAEAYGLGDTFAMERALQAMRSTAEFQFSIIIAQKKELKL